MLDLSFGTKPPDAPKTDGEIVAQTTADCAVYATPGLVGCIAAADSIVTGKSFAEGLTSPFRHGCVSPASSARVPMLAFCHVAPPQRVACMNRGAAVQAAAKGVGTQAGLVKQQAEQQGTRSSRWRRRGKEAELVPTVVEVA